MVGRTQDTVVLSVQEMRFRVRQEDWWFVKADPLLRCGRYNLAPPFRGQATLQTAVRETGPLI